MAQEQVVFIWMMLYVADLRQLLLTVSSGVLEISLPTADHIWKMHLLYALQVTSFAGSPGRHRVITTHNVSVTRKLHSHIQRLFSSYTLEI